MLITIYDSTGTPKAELSPNDSSTQVKEIQGDSILTLSFTHYDHISLDVDDYVDFEGERFWLTEKYRPRQNARKEWVYDIKLYGVESMLKRLLVIKTVDDEDDPVFTLTAPPREHVAMIVGCMNTGLGNISDWKVGQVEGTENIVIDYFGKYCDEALKEIAEKVGAEVWVEGETVNICKCEHGEPIPMGYDKGLLSIDPGTADNVKFYTRLYPVGSSRNIDRERYGYSRLQLPGGQKYVEINADKYGRVDHYEADAFADIYPRRTGVVSDVRSEVRTGEDGNPFTIYYFSDSSLPFDPNAYEIGGLVKRVSFQEGSELAGLGEEDKGTYYFEVNFNSSTREFEIITIWPYDNDMQLPGDKLIPKIGDRYILWNLRMPDEYYELAEAEFMSAVDKYNADHSLDISVYKAATDHVWIEDNEVVLTIGQRIRLESEEYFPETGYRESRITKITRRVNLPSSMDIEIGDALSRTAQEKMSDSIDDVRSYAKSIGESVNLPDIIRSWDKTLPTDNNLFSSRRCQKEFLSKNTSDRTPYDLGVGGRVTAEGGVQFGDSFADGLTGHGGLIDGSGAGTLDSLTLRRWLEVPELRYNRVTVLRSVTWATSGGGIIESVVASDATHGRAWLKLEEGEPGSLVADDICMGIWHDIAQTGDDSDDGRGNFRFRGFRTCYFRVMATASDGSWIDYELRPVSASFPVATHPVGGMHVAGYGNFTDASRQQSRYETTGYVRFLHGVCDWEFGEANVAAQFGDLSNLTVGGVAMKGYSVYLDNVYMSGVIRKVDLSTLELQVKLSRTLSDGSVEEVGAPAEIGPGDMVTLSATVRDGWSTPEASCVTWSLERSTGDADADLAWVAAHPFDGAITLGAEDLGAVARVLFTVVCSVSSPDGALRELRRSVTLLRREPVISDAGVWAPGRTYLDGTVADAQGRLVTHDVWHNGQRWRCVVANTSDGGNAPGVGSAWWVFVAGDDELHVSFAEPEMLASLADFRYPLTVVARWHGEDVTSLISDGDVVWERYTETAEGVERGVSDAVWNAANSGRGREVLLTLPDLDIGSDGIGVTRFTATVTFRPPSGGEPMVESIAWEGV